MFFSSSDLFSYCRVLMALSHVLAMFMFRSSVNARDLDHAALTVLALFSLISTTGSVSDFALANRLLSPGFAPADLPLSSVFASGGPIKNVAVSLVRNPYPSGPPSISVAKTSNGFTISFPLPPETLSNISSGYVYGFPPYYPAPAPPVNTYYGAPDMHYGVQNSYPPQYQSGYEPPKYQGMIAPYTPDSYNNYGSQQQYGHNEWPAYPATGNMNGYSEAYRPNYQSPPNPTGIVYQPIPPDYQPRKPSPNYNYGGQLPYHTGVTYPPFKYQTESPPDAKQLDFGTTQPTINVTIVESGNSSANSSKESLFGEDGNGDTPGSKIGNVTLSAEDPLSNSSSADFQKPLNQSSSSLNSILSRFKRTTRKVKSLQTTGIPDPTTEQEVTSASTTLVPPASKALVPTVPTALVPPVPTALVLPAIVSHDVQTPASSSSTESARVTEIPATSSKAQKIRTVSAASVSDESSEDYDEPVTVKRTHHRKPRRTTTEAPDDDLVFEEGDLRSVRMGDSRPLKVSSVITLEGGRLSDFAEINVDLGRVNLRRRPDFGFDAFDESSSRLGSFTTVRTGVRTFAKKSTPSLTTTSTISVDESRTQQLVTEKVTTSTTITLTTTTAAPLAATTITLPVTATTLTTANSLNSGNNDEGQSLIVAREKELFSTQMPLVVTAPPLAHLFTMKTRKPLDPAYFGPANPTALISNIDPKLFRKHHRPEDWGLPPRKMLKML